MRAPNPAETASHGADRYVTLDGMRGIAALAVALFHFDQSLVPHGYLAVDFFFALSGFVLYRAYRPRWEAGLGTRQFLLQRVVRLYPLFLLGVLLTTALAVHKVTHGLPFGLDLRGIAVSAMFNAAMLPSPMDMPLFPLNVPSWSLFFELVANVALIVLLFRLPRLALAAICVFAAVNLAPIILDHGSGNIGALWGEYGVALLRTAFSFTFGVLVGTLPQDHARPSGPGLLCFVLIVVVLAAQVSRFSVAAYDLGAILVASPVLLLIGTRVEPGRFIAPVATFVGDMSYALYAVHWAFIGLFRHIRDTLHIPQLPMAAIFLGAMLALAWLCVRWFDAPMRRRMGQWIAPRQTARVPLPNV
ncbi:acyltransferase family protein [Novosphingobium album (ex Liu et al. 2023)]|uniref:Acyltransferase n=1 Tax=Novosphingobium album (ex Liu et al. 2023) TaxID=3031130 RepID=A0ABT5WTL1_9SPHN|nr:acyltransferase [Novosphingobium album (ex Liu et al. 2023)]MDE8653214.1 acyltransferase [Novosphingobium album (ex Liu et al. 2023)]